MLMKREEIPLPEFVIPYEAVVTCQELLYRLEWARPPLPCDRVTVDIGVLCYHIPSDSNKFFVNVQLLEHMRFRWIRTERTQAGTSGSQGCHLLNDCRVCGISFDESYSRMC